MPARGAPDPNRPRYHLDVNIDPVAREVQGTLRVEFTPDIETDKLVFRMWANSPRITRSGGNESVQPTGDATVVDPTTLLVRLPSPAKPGKRIEYSLIYCWVAGEPDVLSHRSERRHIRRARLPILRGAGVWWATDPRSTPSRGVDGASADFDVNPPFSLASTCGAGPPLRGPSLEGRPVRDFALSTGHVKRAHQ